MQGLQGMAYPIADTLKMPLTIVLKKGVGQLVTNGSVMKLPVGNVSIPLLNSIKASYINPTVGEKPVGSGALVRVLGDLYVYVCYNSQSNGLTLFILDAEKLAITPKVCASINQLPPHKAMRTLLPGAVRRYKCGCLSNSKWKQEEINADIVGFGSVSSTDNEDAPE